MIIDVREDHDVIGKWRASLDGVDVTDRCFRADDEAGEVWCYVHDENGQPFSYRGKAAQECRKGKVVITPAPEKP